MIEGVMGRFAPACAVALILAGCGGGSHSRTASPVAGTGPPVVQHAHRPHAHPVSPAMLRLQRALRRGLRRAGHDTGAMVFDLLSSQTLFASGADVGRPPASVEKLYTTIALEQKLGLGARLATRVLGTGHLGASGTWHGNLYLRGGGDPTLGDGGFNRIWEYGYGPTAAQIAHQLTAAGIRRVTGRLYADESLFDTRRGGPQTGYAPDIPDFGGQLSALSYDHGAAAPKWTPATFAAKQLAATLRAQHVRIRAATVTRRTPRHAHRLALVRSPPLSVLLRLMDVPSDDLFAELLTKQLGLRFAHGGTIAAGAGVISRAISSYGIHPAIVDGSGLSRADRSSPRQVVDLLRRVWHTPEGRALERSLPTLGINGTVRRIGTRTPAQGRCVAKTGTLNYVTNLAGYCAARGHRMVAFALFLDGPSNEQAISILTRLMSDIASY